MVQRTHFLEDSHKPKLRAIAKSHQCSSSTAQMTMQGSDNQHPQHVGSKDDNFQELPFCQGCARYQTKSWVVWGWEHTWSSECCIAHALSKRSIVEQNWSGIVSKKHKILHEQNWVVTGVIDWISSAWILLKLQCTTSIVLLTTTHLCNHKHILQVESTQVLVDDLGLFTPISNERSKVGVVVAQLFWIKRRNPMLRGDGRQK